MIVETVGALAIGLGVAWLALRRLPHRLPDPRLVGPTGAAGGLLGAFVTHTALGGAQPLAVLGGALVLAATLLSLLVRPAGRRPAARPARPA
ncbi:MULTISPECIES: hypothetical protein [Streptomyces]|uniref:Integral membrane protein n=4 Tax=Streptomyces TaxID=1883 RepID=A0A8H9LMS6_9ACTN|nr:MULTISPECIES: hypothetical protein [Streptomyces]MBL3804540.1 hypothetical protein [Streptomyces sp. BRB081]PJM83362.1 hypothetical protein CH313_11195 [Streptomyces sp. TSRI0384-2]RPK86210.1 hypothetical protein EES47_21225 [Streptomyces sp. ADI98-12]WSU35797.1 hypothetical protein OG378_08300 [Streptomyces gougerotii]GFH63551.1 hypothetical protein Srut_00650 [Streptomyces rutgersensis]